MATTTQTVLIEFKADLSGIQSGLDILEKLGKVDKTIADEFRKTNAEINKQGEAFNNAAKAAGAETQSFGRLADLLKQFPKTGINRFLVQMGSDLAKAGGKASDFFSKVRGGSKEIDNLQKELADTKSTLSNLTSEFEKLKNKTTDTTPKIQTLRNELKQVKEQMQQAAIAGGVLSEEYKKLKQRAGELDDTIKDVNSDIANAGSDTRGIDNVVGSISALAGGYSAVQGAQALFGDESEELQAALLNVNAAMAFATGTQQVLNAVTKQGSLARIADATATQFQAVSQRIYDATLKGSIVSLKAFKIALATTGIGLLIIGVSLLISKLSGASSAAKQLTSDLEALRNSTDAAREALQQEGEIAVALLEEQGAVSSKISKQNIAQKENELAAEQQGLEKLFVRRKELQDLSTARNLKEALERKKMVKEVTDAIDASEKNIQALRFETQVLGIKARTQEKEEAKKDAQERERLAKEAAQKQKDRDDKALEAAKKQRALEFEDFKAGIELQILEAEKGSREELELQKKLLRAKLLIDLEGEGLSLNQRKLLIKQFFKDRTALEKNYNKQAVSDTIENQKNIDAALLEDLNLSESDRLAIKIEYLRLVAAQEIEAAEGNAAKIKAINAKLNAEITAEKVNAIRKAAEYEIALSTAKGGGQRRALEAVAANEKQKSEVRINAIRQAAAIEIASIDRLILANREAAKVQGADQAALSLEYEQLLDKKAEKTEETEKKITGIVEGENEKRKASDIGYIQATIAGLQQVGDIIAAIQQLQAESADRSIKGRREEIAALLEAGAITEREARERSRRLETEEKNAKQRAAQQQKNLAVFQALLAIPQAYIAGLTAPFPVGGPLYGAILAGLAATQAGILAAKPVPKFATGKKGSYEGAGIVGDAGAELIQRADGSMEVATRRQMVYLGSRDKVFTHAETKQMLPFVNKEAMAKESKGFQFDYNKMAKAMQNKENGGVNINIDKDGITEWTANGLSRVKYHDKYYNSKG